MEAQEQTAPETWGSNPHEADTATLIRAGDAFGVSGHSPGIEEAQGVTVLVHVGPHKTGTTWLQKQFFPNLDGLIFFWDVPQIYTAFLSSRFGDFSLDTAAVVLREPLAEARARGVPLVISFEALGGRPFGQMFLRQLTAHRIKAVLPQAKILISVREQVAILNSMYGEYLRFGHFSSLRDFLNQDMGSSNVQPHLELEYYDYDRTLAFYEAVFGAKDVLAAPMEWFVREPRRFADQLSLFLGAELTLAEDKLRRTPERPAYSAPARAVLRLLNRLYPADTRNRTRKNLRFAPNTIASKIDRLTPSSRRNKGLSTQRQLVSDLIGPTFAESNRRFAERTGFDLAAHGYTVG